ncbi:M43 family zinc metalloprotease [Algoriphagus hitonicola]|uniref:Por secretion system C-terminal sorting domain-containing protein n=1 Tax=Algoriphagus hitonicola TaxID=435880 RepID=A0A1I2X0H7_9BACT|nr:M43 family zinc metalloprotease [Algoriphagus hitonicola]SFH05441.1 Por secretion system C-terminal sorting domain-containing protein [Algoriphagus hitonicola]
MTRFSRFSQKAILLLFGAFFASTLSFSQTFELKPLEDYSGIGGKQLGHDHDEKCGHGIIEKMMEKDLGYFGTRDFLENWMEAEIEKRRSQPQILSRTQNEVRKIPVVVHVIHRGEEIGQGTNIPLSQIEAQIRILNEDFRRQNSDTLLTPEMFQPVAADSHIEFVLAKRDANGIPTNGIVRTQGPKNSYSPDDAILIGQTSQWDPEIYMNVWVVPLDQPFIGYASFPISDLPGLNFSPTSATADGVTIDYRFFGSGGSAISASRGRTATHEVGHFLGLRHIWGDGGCDVDDFVEDTPRQDNSNNSCTEGVSRFSCGSDDMIQNYMDYTPDACMNLFTLGQVERFNVILENSPRRVNLVNNFATEEPDLADFDLSLTRLISPGDFACNATVMPAIEVTNAGNETLTSAEIELRRNNAVLESKSFSFELETGQSQILEFQNFELLESQNEVEFRLISINNREDQNPDNNRLNSNPQLQEEVNLPVSITGNDLPDSWINENPDGGFGWEPITQTVSGESQDLFYIRHFEYEAQGELDFLISPVIDLTKYPNAQLVFEMAHSTYDQAGFQDALFVSISDDCGNTFDLPTARYQKSGQSLSTVSPSLEEFFPTNNSQFRTELVNLSDFASLGKVRISIITQNSYGNNIFLKNIRILDREEFNYELTLDELIVPSPISDGRYTSESLRVTNTGNLPITSLVLSKITNNGSEASFLATGGSVNPGETFTLNGTNTTREGKNRIDYRIILPNFDQNPGSESSLTRYIIENEEEVAVPWRQNFNPSASLGPWTSLNPESDSRAWEVISLSGSSSPNNALELRQMESDESYWLGSPIFDLSNEIQASLFFDIAAGQVSPETRLRLLASQDAGDNYEEIYRLNGAKISTVNAGAANPNNPEDFNRNYINLTDFTGDQFSEVRVAFVIDQGDVDNDPIYVDNLELFLSADPDPVIPGDGMALIYPNPATDYFNVAFNLPSYQEVNIQIISSTGAIVHEVNYPATLNQTYTFSRDIFKPGLYIVKITSLTLTETQRVILR